MQNICRLTRDRSWHNGFRMSIARGSQSKNFRPAAFSHDTLSTPVNRTSGHLTPASSAHGLLLQGEKARLEGKNAECIRWTPFITPYAKQRNSLIMHRTGQTSPLKMMQLEGTFIVSRRHPFGPRAASARSNKGVAGAPRFGSRDFLTNFGRSQPRGVLVAVQ
jgi:hypothetical protein